VVWTEGIPVLAITFFVALSATRSQSLEGQLLASGVLLACGYLDIRFRNAGAAFWFFMALAFGVSALVTGIRGQLWSGVGIGVVVVCVEALLVRRWWTKRV
jgi:hypothetical protein